MTLVLSTIRVSVFFLNRFSKPFPPQPRFSSRPRVIISRIRFQVPHIHHDSLITHVTVPFLVSSYHTRVLLSLESAQTHVCHTCLANIFLFHHARPVRSWTIPYFHIRHLSLITFARHDVCALFYRTRTTPHVHDLWYDCPTHFKNETVRQLTKGLRTHHHFTLPHCPLANGSIDRLVKGLIRAARALLSELQLCHDGWSQLVAIFQSAMNNVPSPLHNNVTSITASTGRQLSTPISTFLKTWDFKTLTNTEAQQEKAINITDLIMFMDQVHPIV